MEDMRVNIEECIDKTIFLFKIVFQVISNNYSTIAMAL